MIYEAATSGPYPNRTCTFRRIRFSVYFIRSISGSKCLCRIEGVCLFYGVLWIRWVWNYCLVEWPRWLRGLRLLALLWRLFVNPLWLTVPWLGLWDFRSIIAEAGLNLVLGIVRSSHTDGKMTRSADSRQLFVLCCEIQGFAHGCLLTASSNAFILFFYFEECTCLWHSTWSRQRFESLLLPPRAFETKWCVCISSPLWTEAEWAATFLSIG